MVQFDEDKRDKRVEELRKKEEEELARALSTKYNLNYLDLIPIPINTDALRLITEADSREGKIAAFQLVGKKVGIAIQTPNLEKTNEIIQKLKDRGYIPNIFMVSMQSLNKAWDRYKDLSYASESKAGALEISSEELAQLTESLKTLDGIRGAISEVLKAQKSYRVSKILEIILAGALAVDASDIHIEPEEEYALLRYRLDGVLIEIIKFDRETYSLILSRIKLLSGLKLNIKNDAQDGRFSINLKDTDIEIRTSMLPGAYSESIVMRILNPKSISVPIESLGIEPRLFKILEDQIAKPNGMILITGPTGSGKTTTLYAFLKRIHTSEIKIITIEDPIEYHLPGVVQTQTDEEKGYTFLKGLRSALRQDPDVIMVGEIRDEETAEIAINSALTGHLVFSTLHTNDAAGSFPRLIDLGVNPKIITSALSVSMAQRLVRKLCPYCKKQVPIEGEIKTIFEKVLLGAKNKIETLPQTETMWLPGGCERCTAGYKGRIGVFEAILTDQAIEEIVNQNPSEREIVKAAEPQKILTMSEDAVIKILNGVTSYDEVTRVIEII